MEIGPVQFAAIGFPRDADYRGEIIRELETLRGRGLIRLIDLLFVVKDESGDLVALATSDLSEDEQAAFGAVIGGLLGFGYAGMEGAEAGAALGAIAAAEGAFGLKLADVDRVGIELKPGEAAALLLIEHKWMIRLRDAMRRAGGYPISEGFLTPEVLVAAGAGLRTMVGAFDVTDVTEAAHGDSELKTMQTTAAAHLSAGGSKESGEKREAALTTAAIVRTLRVLVDAGIVDPSDTTDALAALASANLIER